MVFLRREMVEWFPANQGSAGTVRPIPSHFQPWSDLMLAALLFGPMLRHFGDI